MPVHDLERLYDEHAAALFAYALNLSRSESDARDALQEVFRRLAGREDPLRQLRDERAFLLRMTHHAVIDGVRRRDSRQRNEGAAAADEASLFAPASDPDETAFRARLTSALMALPPDQRAVVHLKLWEGMTFEEIASLLALSPNTAASRYRYGLDKMRAVLRPLYEEIR